MLSLFDRLLEFIPLTAGEDAQKRAECRERGPEKYCHIPPELACNEGDGIRRERAADVRHGVEDPDYSADSSDLFERSRNARDEDMIYRVHTSRDQRHKKNYDKERKGIYVVKQDHDERRGERTDSVEERGAFSVRADARADLLC